MTKALLVNSARVMANGQVSIPKEIRESLDIKEGDRVSFLLFEKGVKLENSAVPVMGQPPKQSNDASNKTEILSEYDVSNCFSNTRSKEPNIKKESLKKEIHYDFFVDQANLITVIPKTNEEFREISIKNNETNIKEVFSVIGYPNEIYRTFYYHYIFSRRKIKLTLHLQGRYGRKYDVVCGNPKRYKDVGFSDLFLGVRADGAIVEVLYHNG